MLQQHLSLKDSVDLGSFYTPFSIVEIAFKIILKHIDESRKYVLLDSSCGYGNFLGYNALFKDKIGADIDEKAIEIAKSHFRACKWFHSNSLQNVSRQKFHLTQNEPLIIIGNPPYNDKSSIVKNHIKSRDYLNIDHDLIARDIGISFLLSFEKLQADFVCVLHPLSYLIKKANFKLLGTFKNNYSLIDSCVIDSKIFCPKSSCFFPILIGLYKKDTNGMKYEDILKYPFKTNDAKNFRLNEFDTIARYIDKYPNKKKIKKEESVAMFYTIRDINALKRSQTFILKDCANAVYVTQEKYSYYCYVNVFKKIIPNIPYYFGNCDIPINHKEFLKLEQEFIEASEKSILNNKIKLYFKKLFGTHYQDKKS